MAAGAIHQSKYVSSWIKFHHVKKHRYSDNPSEITLSSIFIIVMIVVYFGDIQGV